MGLEEGEWWLVCESIMMAGLGLDGMGWRHLWGMDAPGMVMPPSILLSSKGEEAALSEQEVSESGADHLEATWTQRKNRGHLVEL